MLDQASADASAVRDDDQRTDTSPVSRRTILAGGATNVAALTGLAGCTGGDSTGTTTQQVEEVTVLLTPGKPTEIKKDYTPMKRYLNDTLDGVEVSLEVPIDYSAILPALKSGQAEIALDDTTLFAAPNLFDIFGISVTNGTAHYMAMLMTPRGSDLEKLTDLKEKSVSFSDPLSSSGSLHPLWALQNAGVDIGEAPGTDKGAAFSANWSNHKSSLEQVLNEKVDAGATWDGMGIKHVAKDQLTETARNYSPYIGDVATATPLVDVLWWSKPIPKQPLFARKDWDSPAKTKIEEKLTALEDSQLDKYKPDDFDTALPFSKLKEGSLENYQHELDIIDDLGVDLQQE
jgi:phosphonate transport system substrate-binding protein